MSDGYCIVMTTFDDDSVARRVAETLLERRLAACVQITSIDSYYRWEGEVRSDAERLALIKTKTESYDEVERVVLELHSYDTPEIVAVPVVRGSAAYLGWIDAECR